MTTAAAVAALRHAGRARAATAARCPARGAATRRDHDDDHRRRRGAAAPGRAPVHRPDERRGNPGHRPDDHTGPVRRPDVRARVRPDSAGHLRHDSRRDVVHRRAVRSLARVERRRSHHRHGAEGADRDQDRGAAVRPAQPAADSAVAVRQGIQRVGGQPASVRAHDGRRDPPDASARCAAWPAPS